MLLLLARRALEADAPSDLQAERKTYLSNKKNRNKVKKKLPSLLLQNI